MTPFETYKDYLSLKNHFNSHGYDYFKYKGKVSGSIDSFNKRKDKFFFEKVAKHRDAHNLMLANFIQNPKCWIRELAYDESAEQIYLDWLKRGQSLTYVVSGDLKKLNEKFDENFIVRDNQHPILLKLFCSNSISVETLCVLVDISRCFKHWDKELNGDVVWDNIKLLIKKYTPFIKYDREKIQKILIDIFSV
jgi:T4 gene Gp59 loader of gp41 DNA helicase/T4 gene Gp59 loader of gp41 DNA helicase C-term